MKRTLLAFTAAFILVFISGCATWTGLKNDSSDAWNYTKDTSKKVWDGTKEKSRKAYDKVKEAVQPVEQ